MNQHTTLLLAAIMAVFLLNCTQATKEQSLDEMFLEVPERFVSLDTSIRNELLATGKATDVFRHELSLTRVADKLFMINVPGEGDFTRYEISLWQSPAKPYMVIQELGDDPEGGFYNRKISVLYLDSEWKETDLIELGMPMTIGDYIVNENQLQGFITDSRAYYWKNGKFESTIIDSGESDNPEPVSSTYSSSRIAETQITKTEFNEVSIDEDKEKASQRMHNLKSHFESGSENEPYEGVFYPESIKGLINDNEALLGTIQPIEVREMNGYLIFRYHRSIEAEDIRGMSEVVRIGKNGQWLLEYSYFTGGGVGATPTQHEAEVIWLANQFAIRRKNSGALPIMACMDGVNIDAMCETSTTNTLTLSSTNDFTQPVVVQTNKGRSLIPGSSLKKEITADTDIEQFIQERTAEGVELSPEDLNLIRNKLYQLKMDKASGPVAFAPPVDYEKVLLALRSKGRDISYKFIYKLGNVRVYELIEADKSSLVFFNTLNQLFSGGDYHEEIFDQLKASGVTHFSLISGTVKDTKDLTGDGIPELIVNQISNYRTSFDGSSDVYRITKYNELKPANLYAPSVFEGGNCEYLQGYASHISFTEKGIKIMDEQGGYDCGDQNYAASERYYKWDGKKEGFVETQPPTTLMEYLDWIEQHPAKFGGSERPSPGPQKFSRYWLAKGYAPLAMLKGDNRHIVLLRSISDHGEPNYNYQVAFYSDKGLIGEQAVVSGEALYCDPPVVDIARGPSANYIRVLMPACEDSGSEEDVTFYEIRDNDLLKLEETLVIIEGEPLTDLTKEADIEGMGHVVLHATSMKEGRIIGLYVEKDDVIRKLSPYSPNEWMIEEVVMEFIDVNEDAKKDLMILTTCVTGVGKNGLVPFPVIGVYLNESGQFVLSTELSDKAKLVAEDVEMNQVGSTELREIVKRMQMAN